MIGYKSVSLANQVYDTLEKSILNGTYARGEVISEKRLSEELGVSRTPVREAMTRLAHERLIKDSPNGTVVIGISKKDLQDLFEVKTRIELVATGRAVDNISPEGLTELKEIIEKQEFYAQKGDAIKVRDLDTEFHDAIYKECGSTILEGILSPIHHKLMRYRKASLELEHRIMDSVAEHKAIYDAIVEKDHEEVKELMLVHIEHSYHGAMEVVE
ncbi:DNA-binding GntR family transcriptional regulator [Clostridiales Family XIII bacterium PM5-7]